MEHSHNPKFFFITNYDDISSALITFILNAHPDIHCSLGKCDDLLSPCQRMADSVDAWIASHTHADKTINGNINQFTAYELQNKILMEKSRYPLRMISLTASPYLRVKLLMQTWLAAYKTPEMALDKIEKQFHYLESINHEIIHRYHFKEVFQQIHEYALQQLIDLSVAFHKLFIFALAKVITQDAAELPASCKKISLENLLADESQAIALLKLLGISPITPEYQLTLQQQLIQCNEYLVKINQEPLAEWMSDSIRKYIELRLNTIYYPHVDKPLISFYQALGYTFSSSGHPVTPAYSKLISIQLNSNRPAQLSIYFDNIEETADHPEQIEVLINIDDEDAAMLEMLEREIPQRKFTIKYISTPRPKSFCDLWEPINNLLTIIDPDVYFLLNISDEMLFATSGWDTILKKYVGFFPDHLFRLRASRNKIRNYFDRWECSFAQDAIPITTRKWVLAGGDWNPCFGPDSFQQLISFYLAKEGQFSNEHYLRELPILDIHFHGDIPALGIHPLKAWKHNRDHVFAMQICQSHAMQQEARRRAMLIKAHIIAAHQQVTDFRIVDNKINHQISLIDPGTQQPLLIQDYHISWFAVTFTNQLRKLRFYAYFGAGKNYPHGYMAGFASYLKAKYAFYYQLHHFLHVGYFYLYQYPRKMAFRVFSKLLRVVRPIQKNL